MQCLIAPFKTSILDLVIVIVLITLLSGCALFETLSTSKAEKVEALELESRFSEALLIVESQLNKTLSAEKKLYWQGANDKIVSAANQYQQQKTKEIKALMQRSDWQQANIDVALVKQNLPMNTEIEVLLEQFNSKKKRYIDDLDRTLVKRELEYLPNTLPIYEKLFKAEPNDAAALGRLQQERIRRDRTITSLQNYTRIAESQRKFGSALLHMRGVQKLDDSPNVLAEIKRLRGLLAEQAQQRKDWLLASGKANQLSKQQEQQLAAYGKALTLENWMLSKSILDQMLQERPSDGELLGQKTYLDEVFVNEVAEAKVQGEAYYSSGDIERALMLWTSVLPMAPDDTHLTGNIERAQRILDKVNRLRQGNVH